jgi:outer membrane immunogenic protein
MMRWLVAGIALAALSALAQAADLPPAPQSYYKAPAFLPPYSWTGFYIGVNGGGALGRSNWDSVGGFDTTGGLVGGTIGYNYQYSSAVFGVEGDIDWSGLRGSTATATCPAGCTTSDSWLSTIRGRLGYAAGRFMPYVTGGAAFGNFSATSPGFVGATTVNAGWTVGAGLEFAIAGSWTAKAEYLFVDLGKFNCGLNCGALTDNVSFDANILRAGINYRF